MTNQPPFHIGDTVINPPKKLLLIYDGDCGFCRKWISRWRVLTGDKVDYEPYQEAAGSFPEISIERFGKAVQLIEPDGKVSQGAHAVFKTLALVPGLHWVLWAHDYLPGFAFVSESFYAFVAGHRHLFSSMDSCGFSPADKVPTYFFSRWLFLKALALVYLTAFGSLWFQITGLLGEKGILPVHPLLQAVQAQLGAKGYWVFPTLCWFNDSDLYLRFLCGGGILFSIFLFLDLMPVLCLFLLWLLYLSLVTVGQDFLSFQWDNLLLEAGLLSIFLVPLNSRLKNLDRPKISRAMVFLFQWLLFRLMFLSGFVKWTSGDGAWHDLIALHYHYETQPLPTPLAWWMNQLPDWFQKVSCLYMFGVELAVPFLIFGPRRFRPVVFGILVSLQVLILLTGNYCFFNWLALGLCFFVLEDEAWPKAWKEWALVFSGKKKNFLDWPGWIRGTGATFLFLMTVLQLGALGGGGWWPTPARAILEILEPFRSVNNYGLFAVMTTSRPEIIVEGSNDGKDWKAYEFKWKAGDLGTPPHWVAPYQPRLDWQMWFAALGDYRQNPWFVNFLVRLLQGSSDVLALLKTDPFPDGPPRYIRAETYEYHFTSFSEKAMTGNRWKRQYKGAYLPPFSLKDIQGR